MNPTSKFSLLISVYYKEKPQNLKECFDSLLIQTYPPTEVILVEDGILTNELYDIINFYKKKLPIKSVKLETNCGLATALNIGLSECSFDLVARMDSDDFCLPYRFEKQIVFMEQNSNIAVSSSWIEERNHDLTKILNIRKLPENPNEIKKFAKYRNPISHPACIFRKKPVLDVGGYPLIYPEDYPLWSTMLSNNYAMANIQEVLLYMRTGDDFLSRRGFNFFMGQVKNLKIQLDLRFINKFEYAINILILSITRLSPLFIKKILYRIAR